MKLSLSRLVLGGHRASSAVRSFCLCAVVGLLPVSLLAAAKPPNIVLILADDLGYGDVQCLNPIRGKIPTPNLDRLAKDGITFTDAHGGSSVCTPSRYGILTGRYAWRTRLQEGVIDGFSKPLIAPDRLTVPLLLRQRGYHTAAIGKWHLGFTIVGDKDPDDETKKPAGAPVWAKTADDGLPIGDPNTGGGPPIGAQTTDGPITRGFDYFYGVQHARSLGTFFEQDRATELVKPVDALEKLTRRASKYIADEARGGSPFFLYFALTSPHTPIVPSKAWQGRSGLGSYGDFVMETDWAVGEVLAAIRQAGVEGNTLVIATSDNGFSPLVGTAALEAQGHFPSAQFRGYKSDIWDGGHRVPFIARWPERIKPGTECGELICLADFMATCADILGVQLPPNAGEDSVSILPALLGVKHEPLHEAIVHHSIFGQFAIRQGPWKLEFCPGSGGWDSPTDKSAVSAGLPALQLYNLDQDIGEKRNLQAQYPEVVAKLTTLLRHYIADGRSTPGLPQANDVPVSLTK